MVLPVLFLSDMSRITTVLSFSYFFPAEKRLLVSDRDDAKSETDKSQSIGGCRWVRYPMEKIVGTPEP